jgi:mevalonate pyrophosphate decarboxylase
MNSVKPSGLAKSAAAAAALVDSFLNQQPETTLRRETKDQVRLACKIIDDTFKQYS